MAEQESAQIAMLQSMISAALRVMVLADLDLSSMLAMWHTSFV
jgi:hypothetical protein